MGHGNGGTQNAGANNLEHLNKLNKKNNNNNKIIVNINKNRYTVILIIIVG
jgi:hypothetical protein